MPRTREVTPPTTEQVRALIKEVEGTPVEHLTALILGTGCRIGEALAVRWADLDFEANSWRISGTTTLTSSGTTVVGSRTKAGDVRRVALSPGVVDHLKVQRAHVSELRAAARSAWSEDDLSLPHERRNAAALRERPKGVS